MASIKNLSDRALLIILDGFGISDNRNKNAVHSAKTPTIDNLLKNYPSTLIEAGGEAVGLPKGVAGNSEVGHLNLGAGKPVRQDLVMINEVIEKKTLGELPKFKELTKTARENTKRIHLMGLLSDGGVHSHINHLKEVLDLLSQEDDLEIFFHAFMDGRDTKKDIGMKFINELQALNKCSIASVQGRSIGMDRDRRWEKIEHAYNTMTGVGEISNFSPIEYIKSEYEKDIFDEFITPTLFDKNYAIQKGDCVFFLNFRPDRAIQISLAFNDPDFKEFKRDFIPPYFLCMSPYIEEEVPLPILFDKEKIKGGLSEYLSSQGIGQYKIAETEKYAHVTYFFNGGEKKPFKNEEHVLVPSPKEVSTYDLKPEMSAPEVTNKLSEAMEDQKYKFYLVNFANSDMVGHTGKFSAAVKAVEALDECLKKLIAKADEQNIMLFVTADHGNSDRMEYEDGSPHTSHTKAPVPFIAYHKKLKNHKVELNQTNHALKDVAATVLYSLGIDSPESFRGINIFK